MTGHDHGTHAGHSHAAAPPPGLRGRRLIVLAAALVALATLVGLVLLRPAEVRASAALESGERTAGTVVALRSTPCDEAAPDAVAAEQPPVSCVRATVRIDEGPDAGREVEQPSDLTTLPGLEPGRGVVLLRAGPEVPFEERYQLLDEQRGLPLLALTALFVLAVAAVGRRRGLLALAGLAASLLVLAAFLVPALLSGRPPVLTAVVAGSAVMLAALFLAHGLTLRAATALLGTTLGLLVTMALAAGFVELASLTGLSSDDTAFVRVAFPELDVRGLLLAGIVIGSLGVLDDVTVTQVSTVWELRRADPEQSRRSLYAAAMRVGRDHIASTTNTLLLAYAGASLPVLVLFSSSGDSLVEGVTTNLVAEEVVRTLAGSVGLVSAVPLTTALAAWCCLPASRAGTGGRTTA